MQHHRDPVIKPSHSVSDVLSGYGQLLKRQSLELNGRLRSHFRSHPRRVLFSVKDLQIQSRLGRLTAFTIRINSAASQPRAGHFDEVIKCRCRCDLTFVPRFVLHHDMSDGIDQQMLFVCRILVSQDQLDAIFTCRLDLGLIVPIRNM